MQTQSNHRKTDAATAAEQEFFRGLGKTPPPVPVAVPQQQKK